MKDQVIAAIVGILFLIVTATCYFYDGTRKKYSMNLKCIQGELYEEIKPNLFVKSHLECFEQTRL